MNKKLKKALVALAVAPCMMLSSVGCFGKDDPPPETGLTATEKNEAYVNLKTLTSQKKFVDATSTASKLGVDMKMTANVNMEHSGLGSAGETYLEEEFGVTEGETNIVTMSMLAESGYKSDNTGYLRSTTEMSGQMADVLMGGSMKSVQTEFTKVSGTGTDAVYTAYAKSDVYEWAINDQTQQMEWKLNELAQEKSASLVDGFYTNNTYRAIFNNDEMSETVQPALDFLTEYDTYTELAENFDEFANDMLKEYEVGTAVSLPETATATADITLTDGVYELKATIDINDLEIPANDLTGAPASKADIDVNMVVHFDSDSVNSVAMDLDIVEKQKMSTFDALSGMPGAVEGLAGVGVTVTDDDTKYIESTSVADMGIHINTQETFDNTIIEATPTGYTGEGVEGAIVNRKPTVTYVFAQDVETTLDEFSNTSWGESYGTITAEQLDLMDGTTVKFYSDPAMTQEITATSIVPSYDHTVYVKVTPPEGYAYILVRTHDTTLDHNNNYGYTTYSTASPLDITTYVDATISSVVVNGQAVTNYASGLTLENKVYVITITYASEVDE